MNQILTEWNRTDETSAVQSMIDCCASSHWAEAMTGKRPFHKEEDLLQAANELWSAAQEADWLEAFTAHPRIGEQTTVHATSQSSAWSQQEQASAASALNETNVRLAELNKIYEDRFSFTYIVCATGKTAEEMLHMLEKRLTNDRHSELREAAEQQRQITQIRLRKWLRV